MKLLLISLFLRFLTQGTFSLRKARRGSRECFCSHQGSDLLCSPNSTGSKPAQSRGQGPDRELGRAGGRAGTGEGWRGAGRASGRTGRAGQEDAAGEHHRPWPGRTVPCRGAGLLDGGGPGQERGPAAAAPARHRSPSPAAGASCREPGAIPPAPSPRRERGPGRAVQRWGPRGCAVPGRAEPQFGGIQPERGGELTARGREVGGSSRDPSNERAGGRGGRAIMPLIPGGGNRQYRAPGAGLPGAPLPRSSPTMMSMNSKQAFSMHPILHEPKYPHLHTSSEAIRRACLPAPQVSRTSAGLRVPPGMGFGGPPCAALSPTYFLSGFEVLGGHIPRAALSVRRAGGCRCRRGCSELGERRRGKSWGPRRWLRGEQPSCPSRRCQPAEEGLCGTPAGSLPCCGCSLFWEGGPGGTGGCPGSDTLLLVLLFRGRGERVELRSSYLSQALLEGQSGISITLPSF